jgi:hypothetical protein
MERGKYIEEYKNTRKSEEYINPTKYTRKVISIRKDVQPTLEERAVSIISRRDKIDAFFTGIAVGYLAYDAATPLPESSARITIGVMFGLGAAAFRGYTLPVIESLRKQG